MRRITSFLQVVAAAAIVSGGIMLFMTPEGRSAVSKYQSWWMAPKTETLPPTVPQSTAQLTQAPPFAVPQTFTQVTEAPPSAVLQTFAQLNVIDDTRHLFSLGEQKAIFEGLSDLSRDPRSMQVRKLGRVTDDKYEICGEVNLKNGLGGYVGFTTFFGVIGSNNGIIHLVDGEDWKYNPEENRRLLAQYGCRY
jgi:hypothetical protein